MNYYLTGMPGCGKSTLGKSLSKSMNMSFVDMDAEIERREKLSIPEIFENSGEDYFRSVENAVLKEIALLSGWGRRTQDTYSLLPP